MKVFNIWNLSIAFIVENGPVDCRRLRTFNLKVIWGTKNGSSLTLQFKHINWLSQYWADRDAKTTFWQYHHHFSGKTAYYNGLQMAYFNIDKNMPISITYTTYI